MDILSYSGINDRVGAGVPDPFLGESEDHNWCLFSIEVRNTYGLPFEVTFDRVDKGRRLAASSGPGCTNTPPQVMSWLAHVALFPQGRPPGV